jgi:hypothetical protein
MQLSRNFYRLMFFFGALWNFSFAIPGLLFPEFSIKLTFGTEMDQSLLLGNYYAHSMYLFWWGAVLLLGIGYYMVSLDINPASDEHREGKINGCNRSLWD